MGFDSGDALLRAFGWKLCVSYWAKCLMMFGSVVMADEGLDFKVDEVFSVIATWGMMGSVFSSLVAFWDFDFSFDPWLVGFGL